MRFAIRQLRHSPAFTITVLLTLGLCIGANTAIFTVIDTLFFRPLPYPDPNRLVMIETSFQKGTASAIKAGQNGRQWELIRDHASYLEPAVYPGGAGGVNLYAGGQVKFVRQQRVSAGFFKVLGIPPMLGRAFTRQEDTAGGPAVAVLSYGLWQGLFHGDASAIGKAVELKGAPFTVVGVMPRGFSSDVPVDVWTPVRASHTGEGSGSNFEIIARLRPRVTMAEANGQLVAVTGEGLKQEYPGAASAREIAVPLQNGWTQGVHTRLTLIWGAVALVLLIGCVNIAGLLLARSATRSREIATRMAIGAGRGRIVWQLLVEAVLLAVGGGALGLLIGEFALRGLIALNPREFSFWGPIHLDVRVAAVMLGVSLVTSIIFGLFPALEATAVDLRSSLAEGGRGTAGARKTWKRQGLVFLEVTFGVVLVIGAGLLVRTFEKLANLRPGFNPNNVLTASASLQDVRYATTSAGARLFRETLARMRQIPGVGSAAVALSLPYQRPLNDGVQRPGAPGEYLMTNLTYITPEFFETLQIPRLRGRLIQDSDTAGTEPVAVINQAFVARYLRGQGDPIGTPLIVEGKTSRVVGVVANVEQSSAGWGGPNPLELMPQMYVPADQLPDALFSGVHVWFDPSWIVRTHGTVPGIEQQMRAIMQSVDPRLTFSAFQTMDQVKGAELQGQRYYATLFSALAGLAILLSALGIYGLVAQSVVQRTREMGIRLALGATVRQVVEAAARPAIVLSLAGVAVGVILALFVSGLMKSMIWGVTATDPLTFVSVAVLLVAIAAIASLVPALRLTRLDPAETLREE
ncbi:MAG TPA: ABC transporter permease [Bryobacteraceae bacterium]|nr:ABC transporter permease [Bryobacteraceae bacterium]